MTNRLPRARRDDLLSEAVVDELLIYDVRSHQVHCLSPTATAIWRACDGRTPVRALAARVRATSGIACDETLVRFALAKLGERDLLDPAPGPAGQAMSRRALMTTVGIPALLVPLVTSLSAPTPAMAHSCPATEGPQGPQGVQGPQGPQGLPLRLSEECQGPQGPQGPQGVQGPQGPQG